MVADSTLLPLLESARAAHGAAVMGVCNVTPDSFSDGGQFVEPGAARRRVDEILSEGADIVDVGGESTRPGAPPVPPGEQLRRVLDVVRHAVDRGAYVSVDTSHPEVAGACLEAGARLVNDVSCLRDQALARVVASAGGALLLMHSRGSQQEMRGFSQYPDAAYGDVVADVLAEWAQAAARAASAGLPRRSLAMDPGLGFAKNARQSMRLLARLGDIVQALDVPVAVGASRKSFLALADPDAPPGARIGGSIAAALHAARAGAYIVRVHDVRATRQALALEHELGRRHVPGSAGAWPAPGEGG
jgi:dihydropteroate synthase